MSTDNHITFPQVAIPVSGDQPLNAMFMKTAGLGETVPFKELSVDGLVDAITKVVSEASYALKAEEFGSLINDQKDTPLDRAAWNIERLIRHPNIIDYHRAPVHDVPWYQYHLLDVYGTLLAMELLIIFVFYKIVQCICCRRKKPSERPDSRKKRQ